jgi:UPF0755 protein
VKRTAFVVVALAAAVLAVVALIGHLSSPPGGDRTVEFTVMPGWGARHIAEALADSGLVRSPLYVLWRAERLGVASGFQAGRYLLHSSMEPDSILVMIAEGRVIPVPTTWITLPEGLTGREALSLIADSMGFGDGVLDSIASDPAFLAGLGVPRLEGYLFPETYEFADTLAADEVLVRITSMFRERWDPSWDQALAGLGLDAEEAVILASLVEREARLDGERPLVAGVFLRRLRIGMRLESCATVQYALGEVRERLSFADLRTDSPYNTYLHAGLPPGPICSPGTASLSAVAHPDTSAGYLYFVSREDGTGGHLFATTLSGHAANIRAVRSGVLH